MSDDFGENEDDPWEDVALRRIFLECLAFSSSTSSSLSSLPSTTSEVYVSDLIKYIRDNAFGGYYRSEELLEELRTAIEEVSSDGRVNWTSFKKASRRWVEKIWHSRWQDSNNNTDANYSNDDLIGRSDDGNVNSEGRTGNDRDLFNIVDHRRNPKTPRRLVTADFVNLLNISSYSPNSDTTHGCCTMSTDTTPESADDTDVAAVGCGEVGCANVRLRVRRLDEENTLLREELVRAEELSSQFQRQFHNLRRKLDHVNEKFRQLEHENDEYKETIHEVEQKERDCRLSLQKAEKERGLLAKQVEQAESERQLIAILNSELETCKRENSDCVRKAIVCRQELEERQIECEMLREKLVQIAENNGNLQQSYEETLRHLRQQNQQLKNEIFDLQSKQSQTSLSDGSTPYSDSETGQMQDSLYAELKASGFSIEDNANESKIRELEEELCWYNEEIREAVAQIQNVLDKLERHRGSPDVPKLSLDSSTIVKTADIYELLQKTNKLSNAVNEIIWKPKVKDACSQLCCDSGTLAEQRMSSQYGIFKFEDCPRLANGNEDGEVRINVKSNERRESGFFSEPISTNCRSLAGEDTEQPYVTKINRETESCSPSNKKSTTTPSGIEERTIIDPIVEELDRILQCTNPIEGSPSNFSPTKNSKLRSIYTCAEPLSEQRESHSNNCSTESVKGPQRNLAATYVIYSGGDASSSAMINDCSIAHEDDTGCGLNTLPLDDSIHSEVSSSSGCSLKTNDYIFEQSNVVDVQVTKSNLDNMNLITPGNSWIPSTGENGDSTDGNGITHCPTLNNILRNNPKRKISVFHRSFDIDTLETVGELGSSETYRLTERSMSTPNPKRKNDNRNEDKIELDDDSIKKFQNNRNFSTSGYRTSTNNSDSSEISSPEKSLTLNSDVKSSTRKITSREMVRPIVRAPKLILPSSNDGPGFTNVSEISATRENNNSDSKSNEQIPGMKTENFCGYSTSIGIDKNDNVRKMFDTEGRPIKISETREVIRPGDEIERGITFRRRSLDRKIHFPTFSVLSPAENCTVGIICDPKLEAASTIIPSSDSESTSCDSSPQRVSSQVRPSIRPPSINGNQKTGKPASVQNYGSKFRDSRPSGDSIEMLVGVGGYQTRNVNAVNRSTVGSYGSVGGIESSSGGIGGSDVKPRVAPPVALAMSSGEDSSDSECVSMAIRDVDETRSISPVLAPFVNGRFLVSSTPASTANLDNGNAEKQGDIGLTKSSVHKRDNRQRIYKIRRSLSESGCGRSEWRCQCTAGNSIRSEINNEQTQTNVFPSLTDARLHESGIANLSTTDEFGGSLTEADLERKATALSVGLVTDRVTLPRRMALSIRQRDQSEKNLACEIQKMHQDIQDLGPLCIDRESLERVERVRHQVEMITQCAHRVSCTAETLGAVHQEHRISRAVFLADRYLVVLRARCEKLASNLAETKRILTENNIVVEENNGEVGDDLPRIRYRGMPTNNRTMMARRRASIATIFRPLGNFQDVTKDGIRQRNSVSGRVTLRRPSLTAESHKWEVEKLDRTDSSSSIGELREIFEQAESRRNSREENNNVLRLHSSNLSIRDCDNSEGDTWASTGDEPIEELLPIVDGCQQSRLGRRTPFLWMTHTNLPWKTMLWCIIISFLLGFYMKHVVSSVNGCSGTPLRWWSIEEILGRYADMKNQSPRPI